jgi:superkiller protein 3
MRTGLQVILATALIHFFPPKHHKEATRIVDEVLTFSPLNQAALMGRGFILQGASTWEGAVEAFDRVFELIGDDDEERMTLKAKVSVLRGLRSKEESAWCLCQLGRHEEALSGLENVSQRLTAGEVNDDARIKSESARCHWRIGKCLLASESESNYSV